ncbi:MAG: Ribose ABC transport system, permease protein RbsC, partial [uncultured Thermoleophilia bacterium]
VGHHRIRGARRGRPGRPAHGHGRPPGATQEASAGAGARGARRRAAAPLRVLLHPLRVLPELGQLAEHPGRRLDHRHHRRAGHDADHRGAVRPVGRLGADVLRHRHGLHRRAAGDPRRPSGHHPGRAPDRRAERVPGHRGRGQRPHHHARDPGRLRGARAADRRRADADPGRLRHARHDAHLPAHPDRRADLPRRRAALLPGDALHRLRTLDVRDRVEPGRGAAVGHPLEPADLHRVPALGPLRHARRADQRLAARCSLDPRGQRPRALGGDRRHPRRREPRRRPRDDPRHDARAAHHRRAQQRPGADEHRRVLAGRGPRDAPDPGRVLRSAAPAAGVPL